MPIINQDVAPGPVASLCVGPDNRPMPREPFTDRTLGCHLSIGKGFPAAIAAAENLGNSALQFFTHNASQWRMKPITPERAEAFVARRSRSQVRFVVAHTMYLLNLASPDEKLYEKSIGALAQELVRAAQLQLDAVVTHLGAHVGSGADAGIRRVAAAIDRAVTMANDLQRAVPPLLLENTAKSGTTIGGPFEELAQVLDGLESNYPVDVCLDTAHAFAAGYDLSSPAGVGDTLAAFDRVIGRRRLCLIHLNDSKYACGSRRDRHEHIGWGEIGREGIGALLQHPSVERVPVILETPKEVDGRKDADQMNLATVRSLMAAGASESTL